MNKKGEAKDLEEAKKRVQVAEEQLAAVLKRKEELLEKTKAAEGLHTLNVEERNSAARILQKDVAVQDLRQQILSCQIATVTFPKVQELIKEYESKDFNKQL